MDEQVYWRNIIANEIKAEHDRVKKYYSQRSANSGGISPEEQTRLNIFLLCQSIAGTYKGEITQAQPVKEEPMPQPAPEPAPEPAPQPVVEAVPQPAPKPAQKPRVQKNPPTSSGQNEFGEIL